MKFTKMRLNGLTVVDLPIEGALPSDPHILKGLDGAGPPELNVAMADTLNGDQIFQGRQAQGREIVALVGLNPDFGANQSASDLRDELYGMLTPGYVDYVPIQFINVDEVVAQVTGYVKRIEINPFSKDPEVQLTIPCKEKQLVAPEIIFLEPESKTNPSIMNVGTAPAGFHMEVIFTSALTNWLFEDESGKKMEFLYEFEVGDRLEIDTRPGSRGVWLTRGGIRRNVIYILSADSTWYMLYGGENTFATSSDQFNWGDVYFQPRFWGI